MTSLGGVHCRIREVVVALRRINGEGRRKVSNVNGELSLQSIWSPQKDARTRNVYVWPGSNESTTVVVESTDRWPVVISPFQETVKLMLVPPKCFGFSHFSRTECGVRIVALKFPGWGSPPAFADSCGIRRLVLMVGDEPQTLKALMDTISVVHGLGFQLGWTRHDDAFVTKCSWSWSWFRMWISYWTWSESTFLTGCQLMFSR